MFFALLFPVQLLLLTITYAQSCGNIRVCVQPVFGGQHRVTLTVSLNAVLPGSLTSVDASGYTYNYDSTVTKILSTPGNAPSLNGAAKFYSDSWIETTGTGSVQIGFPFIRGYSSATNFCYGNFRHVFNLASSGASVCRSSSMFKGGKIDFALVVDTTGSMNDDIAAVKSEAYSIVDTLSSLSSSFRGAVVEYNDRPGVDASVVQEFTFDVTELQNAINGLSVSGGGDNPECVYDGLALALALPWDLTARRVTVTMGDAPGKVCESGITVSDVVSLTSFVDIDIDITPSTPITRQAGGSANSTSGKISLKLPVKELSPLYMVPIGVRLSDFDELANTTGGETIFAGSASEVVGAIETAIGGGSSSSKVTKDLSVSIDCRSSTSTDLFFIINNPNDFNVNFEWQNLIARQRGSGVATPGSTTVRTAAVANIFFTLKWTKEESGGSGSLVYTSSC